jgi:hypothetical protein
MERRCANQFRERYDLSVLAIWRKATAAPALGDLRYAGDAFLIRAAVPRSTCCAAANF